MNDKLIAHAKKLHEECETWSSRQLRNTYAQPEAVRRAEEREAKEMSDAPMRNAGVYSITNIANQHRYIGSSIRKLSIRQSEHWSALKKNRHPNRHLQNAWNKHGEDTFVFEVLLNCDPVNCLMYEQISIDHYQPVYNINQFVSSCGTDPKLSNDEVREVLVLLISHPTLSYQKIADDYNVTPALIGMIFKGSHRDYVRLNDDADQAKLEYMRQNGREGGWLRGSSHKNAKLNEGQVSLIKTMMTSGYYDRQMVAKFFGLASNSVKKIEKNESWKTVKSIDEYLHDYIRSDRARLEIQDEDFSWNCPVTLTYAMERLQILHTKLFELEDAVRNPNLSNEQIGVLKRRIDQLNGEIRPRLLEGLGDLLKKTLCTKDKSLIDETSTKDYQARE